MATTKIHIPTVSSFHGNGPKYICKHTMTPSENNVRVLDEEEDSVRVQKRILDFVSFNVTTSLKLVYLNQKGAVNVFLE